MRISIFNVLAGLGAIVAFTLSSVAWQAADADERNHKSLSITEVHVVVADPDIDLADTIHITVDGANLDDARNVAVVLGAETELVVLSAAGNQIVALCPGLGILCEDGDYRLTVAVEMYGKHGKRRRLRTATYDLTIGAVGPQGEQGDPGVQGEPGVSGFERISCGPITVSNPTLNGQGKESVTCPCQAGKVAVAGGVADLRFPISVANSRDFNIAALHPTNDIQWRVRWYNGTGASVNVTLYTVCVTAN